MTTKNPIKLWHLLAVLFMWLLPVDLLAQAQESISVLKRDHQIFAEVVLEREMNGYEIARVYHLPPYIFSSKHPYPLSKQLDSGTVVALPIGFYNRTFVANAVSSTLKFKVAEDFSTADLAAQLQLTEAQLLNLNPNISSIIKRGSEIIIGYLEQEVLDTSPDKKMDKHPEKLVLGQDADNMNFNETPKLPKQPINDYHQQFLEETFDETVTLSETGTAAFFEMKFKAARQFYAFHNSAAKGSIIKIINPGSDRAIFAKVLGPVPGTKMYHKCIVGISSNAKAALGPVDNKMWCTIVFAGY